MDRFDCLRLNLSRSMTGVEIGPFYSPIAPKADGWDTTVIDFTDAAHLREIATNHPAEAIRTAAHRIEEVDIVWQGQALDEAVIALRGDKVDYVLASHVIEHTTDILRFLQQCSNMLKPDGVISLAVPDMRKTFDLLKSPTSTAEVLAAYREKRTRHTPETLFSAVAYATQRGDAGCWVEGNRYPLAFASPLAWAAAKYATECSKSPDDDYVDAHAWVFTPAGFQLVMLELHALGLIDFAIDTLTPNAGSEFVVQMRRRTCSYSPDALQAERMRLAMQRYTEFAAEVFPPQPVSLRRELKARALRMFQ